jgi:hypothetical protein
MDSRTMTRKPTTSQPRRARLFGENAPLGFNAGDANVYRYVGNDATNAVDPNGLFPIGWDKPKPGQREFPLEAPIDGYRGAYPVLLRTATDSKGNKIELWCSKEEFFGKISMNEKSFDFGRCVATGGINYWFVEKNADGSFKEFYWYNVAPDGANRGARSGNEEEFRKGLRKQFRLENTCADDDKTIIRLMGTQARFVKELSNDGKTIKYGMIRYQMSDKKVYRLYYDILTKTFEWREDKDVKIDGAPGS